MVLEELVREKRLTRQSARLIEPHIFAKIDAQGHWRDH
jgi:hypothetical protein